ncbi:MAG: signal peptidase II [Acidobacteria bacterium]|nr:signal peptidase II [Acidobacteriota bacterium]
MTNARLRGLFLLIPVAIIILDQWTKGLVLRNLRQYQDTIEVIPGFFRLVHYRNTGAAFGLGNASGSSLVPTLLTVAAIGVMIFVIVYAWRSSPNEKILQTALHLVMGGAVGNLIDRFQHGSVIDFLDVYVVTGGEAHHWPAFNVADSAICIGIGLLILDSLRRPSERTDRVADPTQT